MKTVLFLISVLFLTSITYGDDTEKMHEFADNYFQAMMKDNKKADKMVLLPFSLDKKKILKTKKEMQDFHLKTKEKMGLSQHFMEYHLTTASKYVPLKGEEYKDVKYEVVKVNFEGEFKGEHFNIYVVRKNGKFLVIGIED